MWTNPRAEMNRYSPSSYTYNYYLCLIWIEMGILEFKRVLLVFILWVPQIRQCFQVHWSWNSETEIIMKIVYCPYCLLMQSSRASGSSGGAMISANSMYALRAYILHHRTRHTDLFEPQTSFGCCSKYRDDRQQANRIIFKVINKKRTNIIWYLDIWWNITITEERKNRIYDTNAMMSLVVSVGYTFCHTNPPLYTHLNRPEIYTTFEQFTADIVYPITAN